MVELKINQLNKNFLKKQAINNLSMSLEKGKVYGLLGPNGHGKSTLMKLIAGLLKPSSGEIIFKESFGVGIESKKLVSFMPTEDYIYPFMTIEGVGKYFDDMFEDFDIEQYKRNIVFMQLDSSQKVKSLSTGMKGKLKVAAALARDTQIYMFDEPLNGIDPLAREQIISCIIQQMNEEKIYLISSHLVHEMESILDEVLCIKDGSIVECKNVEKMRIEEGKSAIDLYREVFSV